MAHPIFHFSTVLAAATAIQIPFLYKKMKSGQRPSQVIARFLIIAYGLAFFAITPNILGHLGMPDAFWTGWWMNVFIFHHAIDIIQNGGALIGELLYILCFTLQYTLILFEILKLQTGRKLR